MQLSMPLEKTRPAITAREKKRSRLRTPALVALLSSIDAGTPSACADPGSPRRRGLAHFILVEGRGYDAEHRRESSLDSDGSRSGARKRMFVPAGASWIRPRW